MSAEKNETPSVTGLSRDARCVSVRVANDGQKRRRRRYRRHMTPTARLVPVLQGLADRLRNSCRRLLITEENIAAVPSIQLSTTQQTPIIIDVATSTNPIVVRVPNLRNQPLYFQVTPVQTIALVIPLESLMNTEDWRLRTNSWT
jgi:hypothetical protein